MPAPTRAATLPSGFSESIAFSGLTNPTVVRFSADGRVFVAEKSGLIKVFDSLTDTTPTTFADLRTNVHNFWDRGLLGMALAPNFPIDPSVYVLYTYDAAIGGIAPRWGVAGATSDGCPSPPGATTDGCVVSGRLSKLTANGNQAGAESVLINDWCQQFPTHSIGTLAFGPDGYLYVSAGDGANPNYADYGQAGGSPNSPIPKNPCGDPPVPVGGTQSPPAAEGGSLRSQDLQTPSDSSSLDGTIIRIDAATGLAAPGNPLATSGDQNSRRIVAYGFRNPFRFTFRPGTNELWIGDVGLAAWEEIDRFTPGGAVANFGWPCYEGSARQPGYDALDVSICENLYAQAAGTVTGPYYTYYHGNKVVAGEACPVGSSSISGLAFSSGGTYPSQYTGALFFADYSRDCIWAMRPGVGGLPDPNQIETFVAGAANPVGLEIGPGGDLFYLDIEGGTIRRVSYGTANQAPTANASASPSSGPAPLTVNFSGTNSFDPDGDPLTYAWDLDADGQFDDGTGATASRSYGSLGSVIVGLRVADGRGGTSTTYTTVTVTGPGPTVTYLSSLNPTSAVNGWGPYERDRSNGGQGASDGRPITLAGVVYARGLGTHALSDLRYTMPSGSCSFLSAIGIDDESGSAGSVTFQVLADATSLYLSPVLTGSSATLNLNLAIPAGTTQLRLVVGNGNGSLTSDHADWADARLSCSSSGPPNTPPVPVIDTPAASLAWAVGQAISFSGHASDAENGTLSAANLNWQLLMQHCPSTCHAHVIQSWTGTAGASFNAPDHEYPSYLELRLTATDAGGLSTTVSRRLDPQTVVLSFASNPTGLQLAVNAIGGTAPFSRTVIVGSANSLSAASPQSLGGGSYAFSAWSDGGAASHSVVAPAAATTYTATYTVTGPGPTVTYLSSLNPTSAVNGWGPYERDRSNGGQGASDGRPITLAGVVYARGLGTHALSDLRYTMPSGSCSFLSAIGIDDESGSAGSVTFQVLADATSLYLSPVLTGSSATLNLNLAIPAGTTQLRLVVGNGNGSLTSDHADWADARLSCS
ncbi:MAG: NPCBM/NEW2 domain-containing protein [Chloroflexota bacterium]